MHGTYKWISNLDVNGSETSIWRNHRLERLVIGLRILLHQFVWIICETTGCCRGTTVTFRQEKWLPIRYWTEAKLMLAWSHDWTTPLFYVNFFQFSFYCFIISQRSMDVEIFAEGTMKPVVFGQFN